MERTGMSELAGGLGSRPGRSVVAVERGGRCRDKFTRRGGRTTFNILA